MAQEAFSCYFCYNETAMNFHRFWKLAPLALAFGFIALLVIFWPKLNQPRIVEIKKSILEATAQKLPMAWQPNGASSPLVNFLLLGAPGEGWDAPDLTDTILIARFDQTTDRIYLFSLPRDLLVKIPNQDAWTKINALYAYYKNLKGQEFDALKQTVQEITGLEINNYIFIDLALVKQVVDLLDGVNILVTKDIYDTAYPGPNHSFETFEIKTGWRYLDGATALKYIRSRQSTSDFDRVTRQQQVLQALKQKALTLNFWDIGTFLNLYQEFSRHVKTDLSLLQMGNFWQQVKNVSGQNVIRQEISPSEFLVSRQMVLGQDTASVLIPRAGQGNYEEIKKYIQESIR